MTATHWITGINGFIGRHLAAALAHGGDAVAGIGFADPEPPPVREVEIGAVEATGLDRLLRRTGPPAVLYHLAGGSSVAASVSDPAEDHRRTVAATGQLLDWLRRRSPATRLVLVSSAAVYGADHPGAIREDAVLTPMSPYGRHKLLAEERVRQTSGLHAGIVRLFSVYGPGLRRQLVWDLCRRLSDGEHPLTIGGSGDELRDWLHVTDACRLLIEAGAHATDACPVVNGGSGQGLRVRAVAEEICAVWGLPRAVRCTGEVRPGDPPSLVADVALAARWGWTPQRRFADGLRETVAWCRDQLRPAGRA